MQIEVVGHQGEGFEEDGEEAKEEGGWGRGVGGDDVEDGEEGCLCWRGLVWGLRGRRGGKGGEEKGAHLGFGGEAGGGGGGGFADDAVVAIARDGAGWCGFGEAEDDGEGGEEDGGADFEGEPEVS